MKFTAHSRWFLWLSLVGSIVSIVAFIIYLFEKKPDAALQQTIKNGVGANIGRVEGESNVDVQIKR